MDNLTKIAVVGNPNCGKSTLFNVLTGSNQMVGNWPGVTVEKKIGYINYNDKKIEITDLPGVYSINSDDGVSFDEKIARDFILNERPDFIVNIINASNIERGLYLTTQLLEMQIPLIIVVNMVDVALKNGIEIDFEKLSEQLSCPVQPVVASKKQGVYELKNLIFHFDKSNPYFKIDYDKVVEKQISEMEKTYQDNANFDKRWFAIHNIEIGNIKNEEYDVDLLIADKRYGYINNLIKEVVNNTYTASKNLTDKIDGIVLHKVFGVFFFLFSMYIMFSFSVDLGGALIDPFVGVSEFVFIEKFGALLDFLNAPELLKFILTNGLGNGIVTIISFIPPIAFLFFALSILEDTGYMSRIAFLMDKFMKIFGLSGTAFVPMLVGFGCTVPALMGTRTLTSTRDRIISMMMIPFMSCGARFPVYAVFVAAMFKDNKSTIVLSLYLIGILVAVITGIILRATVLKGSQEPMVMELPHYHLPLLRNILITTWQRLKDFILRAGSFIVPLVIVLNILTYVNIDGTIGSDNSDKSYLAIASKKVSVVFKPMGISEENWPAVVGIVTGVMAKEAVIGTLSALYSPDVDQNEEVEAEENELFLGKLASFFDGKAGSFAYLLFILLYVPCLAAVATMFKEAGKNWAWFSVFWTNIQAYIIASSFYQIARFEVNPKFSIIFLSTAFLVELLIFLSLKLYKEKNS